MAKSYVVVLNPGCDNEQEVEDFTSYNEAANCRDSYDAQGNHVDIMRRIWTSNNQSYLTTELRVPSTQPPRLASVDSPHSRFHTGYNRRNIMAATAKKVVSLDLVKLVDELGTVKGQIAALKSLEKKLQEQLVATGNTEAEGLIFRATVSFANVESIDWKAIALRLAPSRQLIAGNTSYKPRTTVRLVARKTGGAA